MTSTHSLAGRTASCSAARLRSGNLMDIAPTKQGSFGIVGRTPATPYFVLVTVARFPRPSVTQVAMASDSPRLPAPWKLNRTTRRARTGRR